MNNMPRVVSWQRNGRHCYSIKSSLGLILGVYIPAPRVAKPLTKFDSVTRLRRLESILPRSRHLLGDCVLDCIVFGLDRPPCGHRGLWPTYDTIRYDR